MKKTHLSPLLAALALLLIFTPSTQAQDQTSFSPTVKVRAYEQLLNGHITPFSEASGTLIDSSGLVLTNAHVVVDEVLNNPLGAFSICVSPSPERTPSCRFTASLLRYDQEIDLALLQIDPEPLWGEAVSAFPYLDYNHDAYSILNDEVTVKGFPGNGSEAIMATRGQVAGFEEINGYKYLKTNADIYKGNSGGTMLDTAGNFIGVPTYIRSSGENLGRALSIEEFKAWIELNVGKEAEKSQSTHQMLVKMWQACYLVNVGEDINLESYPKLSMKMPEGWYLDFMNNTEFIAFRTGGNFGYFAALAQPGVFTTRFSLNEFETLLNQYFDFSFLNNKEEMEVAGNDALHLWGEVDSIIVHIIYFPYGHGLVSFIYGLPVEDNEEVQKEIDGFLESLSLNSPLANENMNASFIFEEENYPFTIAMPEKWKILKSVSQGYTLAEIGMQSNVVEWGLIDYFPPYEETIYVKGINPYTDNFDFGEEIFYTEEFMVDGLSGSLTIYEKEGEIPIKNVMAVVKDPEYEIRFTYEVERHVFDEKVEDFEWMLRSFKSKRYDQTPNSDWRNFDSEVQGQYIIPSLAGKNVELTDIAGHRYEENILNLIASGVVQGNPDKTFAPNEKVNRAAALKIILKSLRVTQQAAGENAFKMPEDFNDFPDIPRGIWYETYVAEGLDKKIIEGYPDGEFKGELTVNLAEALKMILEANGLSLWMGETDPWYKKYFDVADALKFLPNDLQDPASLLTRAELAYLVDQISK